MQNLHPVVSEFDTRLEGLDTDLVLLKQRKDTMEAGGCTWVDNERTGGVAAGA